MLVKKLMLVPVAALFATSLFAAPAQKMVGTVTDSMCGAQHGMKGLTAAQCTRKCVRGGASYALMSDGKMYMLKGDKAEFDKFAGEKVVVKGMTDGKTVTVESMKAAG
jgi:hypothetical protein